MIYSMLPDIEDELMCTCSLYTWWMHFIFYLCIFYWILNSLFGVSARDRCSIIYYYYFQTHPTHFQFILFFFKCVQTILQLLVLHWIGVQYVFSFSLILIYWLNFSNLQWIAITKHHSVRKFDYLGKQTYKLKSHSGSMDHV